LFKQIWKEELISQWEAAGIPAFFAEIGVDYERSFLAPLAEYEGNNPFTNHRWYVGKNATISPGVLHMAPNQVDDSPALWEEWFFVDQQMHHHVLRNHQYPEGTETWKGHDDEHPIEVLDRLWHHHNCDNLIPTLLR
jgi:hypothetical protein